MPKENSLMIFISMGSKGTWIKKDAGKGRRILNDIGKGISDVGRGVRESVAPLRWVNEKLFSGYGSQMEQLREVDELISHWTRDLDNVLDQARDARKQGRYLDVFYWLNQINGRLQLAEEAAKDFVDVNQEQFDEFFGKSRHGLQPDYFSKLQAEDITDPNQEFEETVAALVNDELKKTAGMFQDMGEKFTTWKMERLYRKRLQEMKRAMDSLLGEAARTVGHVDALLARMSKARANGDISTYLDSLGKISALQGKFETSFKKTYDTKGFKEMVQRMRDRAQRKEKETSAPTPVVENSEQPTVPDLVAPAPPAESYQEPMVHTPEMFQSAPAPAVLPNPAPTPAKSLIEDVSVPETSGTLPIEEPESVAPEPEPFPLITQPAHKKSEVESAMLKLAHSQFFEELEKTAKTSSAFLMAAMIIKYSEQLEEIDPETSLELLAVAEGILNA